MLASRAVDLVDKLRTTMKYPNSIPLWHPSGELFPGNALCQVVLSSAGTKWNDVVLEQHDFLSIELADVMYKQHVFAINIGHPITCEFKKKGRFRRALKEKDAISFFPSCQPFSGRLKLERDVFGAFIRLGLDPIFVSRIAEELGLDSDRIELVEQRRETDLALRHIALALRAGVQSGDALDRMYGEGLATALAVHLRPVFYQRAAQSSKTITTFSMNVCGAWRQGNCKDIGVFVGIC